MLKNLPVLVAGLHGVSSAVAFAAYAVDKSAARKGQWRTPERTLLALGLIGGWPGAWVAQRVLHHKSRKYPFQLLFRATVLIDCAFLLWLFVPR